MSMVVLGVYLTARPLGDRVAIDIRHRRPFRDPALGKQGAM